MLSPGCVPWLPSLFSHADISSCECVLASVFSGEAWKDTLGSWLLGDGFQCVWRDGSEACGVWRGSRCRRLPSLQWLPSPLPSLHLQARPLLPGSLRCPPHGTRSDWGASLPPRPLPCSVPLARLLGTGTFSRVCIFSPQLDCELLESRRLCRLFLQPRSCPTEGLAHRSSWYWWEECPLCSPGAWRGRALAEWNSGAQAAGLDFSFGPKLGGLQTFSSANMPNGHSPHSKLGSPWWPLLVLGVPWAYVPTVSPNV